MLSTRTLARTPAQVYDLRLLWIREIETRIRMNPMYNPPDAPWSFSMMEFNFLAMMPLGKLRRLLKWTRIENRPHPVFESMAIILGKFFEPTEEYWIWWPTNTVATLDDFMDGGDYCIVTGDPTTGPCALVPGNLTVRQPEEGMCFLWKHLIPVLEDLFSGKEMPLHVISDMYRDTYLAWNRLPLNEQLCHWFWQARCGFKFLGRNNVAADAVPAHLNNGDGKPKTIVTLEFHWLPGREGVRPDDRVDLSTQRRGKDQSLYNLLQKPRLPDSHIQSPLDQASRPIRSGQTVPIAVDLEDAAKFICAIKLHWALSKIAAVSGYGYDDEGEMSDDDPYC
ncbi:hypothetical protein HIM_03990 [Hirsutella minnesotensis 3608]|uniref:HNH nuclease domain-containing protein n=1 Tax=Hirsutella minnesotensis 3608 TaxID=1043627 RepID=A0A0F8A688_9HYPO|nr:hypothetical protein HIM_03990 [Hirsutella minnesotensis 3608]